MAKAACPQSPRAMSKDPYPTGTGNHNWRLYGPVDPSPPTGSTIHLGPKGRKCLWCKKDEPDFIICAQVVQGNDRWPRWWRCDKQGTTLRDTDPGHRVPRHEEGGWFYCGTHDPVRMAERYAARPPSQYDLDSLKRKRERDLIEAVKVWDKDEADTEGFCPEEEGCEHHECKLHYVLLTYLKPLPKTKEELKEAGPLW